MNIAPLEKHARNVRRSILRMVTEAGTSHIGSAFSCVDLMIFIYGYLIETAQEIGSTIPKFVLSKGHAATALYATLAEFGYFDESELRTYCQVGSRLGGHLLRNTLPGIELATGSLGHGLPMALGMARGLINTQIITLLGDGECDEGSVWEAAMLAARLEQNNLTVLVDFNGLQGYPMYPAKHDIGAMFAACGWEIARIDGHDFFDMQQNITLRSRPLAVIARTIKGKGVSFMEDELSWHYRSPKPDEYEKALAELA